MLDLGCDLGRCTSGLTILKVLKPHPAWRLLSILRLTHLEDPPCMLCGIAPQERGLSPIGGVDDRNEQSVMALFLAIKHGHHCCRC